MKRQPCGSPQSWAGSKLPLEEVVVGSQERLVPCVGKCVLSSPAWCRGTEGLGACPGLSICGFHLVGFSEVGLCASEDPQVTSFWWGASSGSGAPRPVTVTFLLVEGRVQAAQGWDAWPWIPPPPTHTEGGGLPAARKAAVNERSQAGRCTRGRDGQRW